MKIEEQGGAPSCPRCERRGDNHTEACRNGFADIEAAEAEAAARAAPAPGVDSSPPPEAAVAGATGAPLGGVEMLVDSNITIQPRDPGGDVSMEANT